MENIDVDLKELVKDLNKVVQEMYLQEDEIVYWARELLAVLRRHGIGE